MASLLFERGWKILDRNWSGAGGELDIVVRDGGRLRIVEVKLRQEGDLAGIECVDWNKLRRVRRAAEAWLLGYEDLFDEVCLLVAMVEPTDEGFRIELFDDPI